MIVLDDFKLNKHGQKKYHFYCDTCNKDRGYLFKYARGNRLTGTLCLECANHKHDKCKKCGNNNHKPEKNRHNKHWFWDKNSGSKAGGYHRCKLCLINKNKKWIIDNPQKAKEKAQRARQKLRSTVKGRLRSNMSSAISAKLKKRDTVNTGTKFKDLWTISQLIAHLESKFQPGMTWDNYGINGWEVDHIKPDSWFSYSSIEDQSFKDCWSLDNLQPLWAEDNRSKSNRFAGGY